MVAQWFADRWAPGSIRPSAWVTVGQELKLEEACESAAPRFGEGLLDFDWQGVRLTPKIKREAVPEPLKVQKWQTPF